MRDERSKGYATPSTETPAARERRVACVDTCIHRGLASEREYREMRATDTPARETPAAREIGFYAAESVCGENGARDRETGARETERHASKRNGGSKRDSDRDEAAREKQQPRMEQENGAQETL